jgi:hypothetical protein
VEDAVHPEFESAAATAAAAAAAMQPASGSTETRDMLAEVDPAVAGPSSSMAQHVEGITASEVTAAPTAAVESEPETKPNGILLHRQFPKLLAQGSNPRPSSS